MKTFQQLKEDRTFITGLVFLSISAGIFFFTMFAWEEARSFQPFTEVFFINYVLFFVYFLIVFISNKNHTGRFWRFYNMNANAVLLAMANISAYSLNRSLPVFNESTDWLTAFLILLNFAMLGYGFRQTRRPDVLNHVFVGLLSAGLLFNLYQMFYTLPLWVIGILGCWFFGIPLHIFVPVWYFIFLILMLKKYWQVSNEYRSSIVMGMGLPLLYFAFVVSNWVNVNQKIDWAYHEKNAAYNNTDLPEWVALSREIPVNWMTERILKSGIVYTAYDGKGHIFDRLDRLGFNERTKHDPFIAAASFFAGPVDLKNDQRLDILKGAFNQRHQSERRLWSGDNLRTSDIVTNVQLFPAHRLAYTEKTLTIKNSQSRRAWNRTQEAIYTFHLPEGSVVTSASLWVEGEERPSFLTTKAKADSAYTTIVGRERRDPLLLHWREGNQVSVRIFPCTPQEARRFKIGVTTPLQFVNEQLHYHNIDFVGPGWEGAKESINVVHEGKLEDFESSMRLSPNGTAYEYRGKYKSDWSLTMKAVPLSTEVFEFNGKSFSVQAHQLKEMKDFNATEIYLDVNSAWSKSECKAVWNLVKNKKVYVFTNRLEQMTEKNQKQLFKHLRKLNYSLFPMYEIANPKNALLISKSSNNTPTLSDLKQSPFAEKTNDFMQRLQSPVRHFSLSNTISPYLKMMKELRLVHQVTGTVERLTGMIKGRYFRHPMEDAQTIALDEAKMMIVQSELTQNHSTAPDHLMRLFVYNDVMKQLGSNYFNKEKIEHELVGVAEEAHVVTPISSLVVLETQADYDRFDIKESKNSLKNAAMKSSGAVPEPHEWALILLALAMVLWVRFRQR